MATETFDKLKKEARSIELALEGKLTAFARLDATTDKMGIVVDEESAISPGELQESAAAREIEGLLEKLIDVTDRMARIVADNPSRTSTAVVQRYREVMHDMKTTFRKQQANHRQRRDAAKLMGRDGRNGANGAEATTTDLLLRERASLSSSNRTIDSILAQAAETRDSLSRQRSALVAAAGGLSGITARMPSAQQLISAIQQRRIFNDRVSATVVAMVVCFFLYWFVLRRV